MFKGTARKFALVLSLTVLAAPMGTLHAAVSGGDPQPTGEVVKGGQASSMILLLSTLSSIFLS